jgi:hypothetical protein
MKKFFGILMLGALGWGAASCSNDKPVGPETPPIYGLSFNFEAPQMPYVTTGVTRAIATDPEWRVATLDVYASVDSGSGYGNVAKLTLSTDPINTVNADGDYWIEPAVGTATDQKYTVTMSDTWLTGKGSATANFYFVANAATSMKGLSLSADVTDAVFRDNLTTALAGAPNELEKINKPTDTSAATINLLFTDVIEDVMISNSVSTKGDLIRRVARFDIENQEAILSGDDAFKINKVIVTNAADRGYVFGTANPATEGANASIVRGYYNNILSAPLINATDYTIIRDGSPAPAGTGTVAQSAFYLYPTTLGPNDTDTHIWVEGVSKGETKLVPVVVDTPKSILANNRYVITVKVTELTATLDEIDYFEGGIVNNVASSKANPLASVTVNAIDESGVGNATWNWNGNFDVDEISNATLDIPAGEGSEIVIPITSKWGINYLVEGTGVTVSKGTTVTGSYSSVDNTITISVAADTTEIDAKISIYATDDKGGTKVINVTRPVTAP